MLAAEPNVRLDWLSEFSIHSNQYQLNLPDAGFYLLSQLPLVRLDKSGKRELVAAEWGLLPFLWRPRSPTENRSAFQRKCLQRPQ